MKTAKWIGTLAITCALAACSTSTSDAPGTSAASTSLDAVIAALGKAGYTCGADTTFDSFTFRDCGGNDGAVQIAQSNDGGRALMENNCKNESAGEVLTNGTVTIYDAVDGGDDLTSLGQKLRDAGLTDLKVIDYCKQAG